MNYCSVGFQSFLSFKANGYMVQGVKIRQIDPHSPFFQSGMRRGDRILEINGQQISDELDFRFYAADSILEITAIRHDKERSFIVERDEGSFLDLDFFESPINRCKNRCIFCFIDQMPPGLRRGLYIKDEDFKHSFLNGNYVTLTGACTKDLEKIGDLGISPIYVSVHATDPVVRNRMLGNRTAPPIMDQLRYLKKRGISFHTQIVICKDYNDKDVLKGTLKSLFSLGGALLSVAVVPVGLTRFRKIPLLPIDTQSARTLCGAVSMFSDRHTKRDGERKLFLADEFFIKADLPIPETTYYENYPQIENGVGLVRQLLEEWKACGKRFKTKKATVCRGKKLVCTSVSAYPFIKDIIDQAQRLCPHLQYDVIPVINEFFGRTVTVAGLLTAEDIFRTIRMACHKQAYEAILVPAIMFNYAGFTLDGYSVERMRKYSRREICSVRNLEELFWGKQ